MGSTTKETSGACFLVVKKSSGSFLGGPLIFSHGKCYRVEIGGPADVRGTEFNERADGKDGQDAGI